MYSRLAGVFISAFIFVFPLFALSAINTSELHILPDGSLTAKSVVVYQKVGGNLFCRVAWGETFIRMTVLVHPDTEITKKFGGKATIDDIKEGDTLEIAGVLSDGTGNMIVKAKKVKNLSVTTESKNISGTIAQINTASSTVTVAAKGLGAVKVSLVPNGIIQKGVRTISFSELAVNDKVLNATGTYDFSTKTLSATLIEIFQDKKIFAPKVFQGAVTSLSGTEVPATFGFTSAGKSYTVYVSSSTKLTSKSKSVIALSRIAVGDRVSVSGSIKETNLSEITATAVRDLAF